MVTAGGEEALELTMSSGGLHANRHIPAFQSLFEKEDGSSSAVQLVRDGSQLTVESLKRGKLNISVPILVRDTSESIGMSVLKPPSGEKVSVRHIADVIGLPHLPVRVMDVEHQEELKGWTLQDLVDYFEDEDRLRFYKRRKESKEIVESTSTAVPGRKKRKAAEKCNDLILSEMDKPRVLNQISLEFSRTALGRKVKSPQFVRDLDWIGNNWPREQKHNMPSVQYYCLTSAEGCYTDFHVDFGGSSVYYHVLSGTKMFVLIKPSPKNLSIYEQWLGHPDQESIFLPDKIANPQDVITVNLKTSQTLFIPAAWIHAVYTPEDAVVLGGNFLHGFDAPLQLEINEIEKRTRVAMRFQFPYFRKIHFYTAGVYLQTLRSKDQKLSEGEMACLPNVIKCLEKWHGEGFSAGSNDQPKGTEFMDAALYAARLNGYESIRDFIQAISQDYETAKNGGTPFTQEASSIKSTVPKKKGLAIKLALTTKLRGIDEALASPKSPRIRLSLGAGNRATPKQIEPVNNNIDETFRIVISSVAKETHEPLPVVKRNTRTERIREDIEYVDVAPDDDEWEPAPSRRNSKKSAGNKKKVRAACPVAAAANKTVLPATKKAKTTARQRLLKKFR